MVEFVPLFRLLVEFDIIYDTALLCRVWSHITIKIGAATLSFMFANGTVRFFVENQGPLDIKSLTSQKTVFTDAFAGLEYCVFLA